jgi:hypothetical protein
MHRYVGASPGCWAVLGEAQVRGYDDARYSLGQLGVDAYMAQHPGTPSPQSIQSVTVHLIGLCLQLEHRYRDHQSRVAMSATERFKKEFTWLEPPAPLGALTVVDVANARDPVAFPGVVHQWARCVWEAWVQHHNPIRSWVARLQSSYPWER